MCKLCKDNPLSEKQHFFFVKLSHGVKKAFYREIQPQGFKRNIGKGHSSTTNRSLNDRFDEIFFSEIENFLPLLFQLRGAQILDAVRLHKNGFPENLSYGEFWRRYRILSDELQKRQPSLTEMKASVEDLLADMDLDKSAFRLGNTQVSHFWPLLFQVSAKITSIHFQRDGFLYLIV